MERSNINKIKLYIMYLETFVGTFLFLSIEEEIYGSLSLFLSLCFWLAKRTFRATSSSAMLSKWYAIYI